MFSIFGTTVSWKSNLQQVVALSPTEAEYIAITEGIKEVLWLHGLIVVCDSQSAVHLTKNHVIHERTKHVDVKFYFVKEVVARGEVAVEKVRTDDNAADMLTKT